MAYLDRGPRDGLTVVYLHGMPSSRHEQRLFTDELLEQFAVRMVSIDRPGWGATTALAGSRIERSRDALTVADHLGLESFSLMCTSAGGSYGVVLAATAGTRVRRLVLCGAQMPYDDESAIATLLPDQLALLPFLRDGRTPLVEAGADDFRQKVLDDPMAMFDAASATMSPAEQEFLRDPTVRALLAEDLRAGVEAGIDGIVDDLVLWTTPFEVDVSSITCPVLALHGDHDDWEPLTNLYRCLDPVPHAEVQVLDGRNHFGVFLHPERLLLAATGAAPPDP